MVIKMAVKKRAGYKVDKHSIIKMAVDTARYIDSWSKDGKEEKGLRTANVSINRPKRSAHTISVKNKAFTRLATTIKNQLHDSKAKSKQNKIAISTYSDYLGDVRKKIQRELNLRSPTLLQDIKKLKEKHSSYSSLFDEIATAKAEKIKTVKSDMLEKLKSINSIEAEDAYNDLKKLTVNHLLISKLAPSEYQSAQRKQDIDNNRKERKQNITTLSYAQIEAVINDCLESDDFYELSLGVALATGRRAIEVIHTGKYQKARKTTDVIFSGVAKKSKTFKRGTKFTIPLLIESKIITDAVKKIRNTDRYKSMLPDISHLPLDEQNTIINRRVAGGLNKTIRSMFNNDNLKFKDSRTIAGHIAVEKIYKVQKRYRKLDIGAFRTMYFIHDTFEEAVNYEHIKIDFNASFDATDNSKAKTSKANTSALEAITSDLRACEQKGIKPVFRLHEKVISTLKENEAFALSASVIYKGKKLDNEVIKIGGSKAVIKRYLENEIVKKAVKQYHDDNNLKTRKK